MRLYTSVERAVTTCMAPKAGCRELQKSGVVLLSAKTVDTGAPMESHLTPNTVVV
jgi:hypothetical protein